MDTRAATSVSIIGPWLCFCFATKLFAIYANTHKANYGHMCRNVRVHNWLLSLFLLCFAQQAKDSKAKAKAAAKAKATATSKAIATATAPATVKAN